MWTSACVAKLRSGGPAADDDFFIHPDGFEGIFALFSSLYLLD